MTDCKTVGVQFNNTHSDNTVYTFKTTLDFEVGDSAVVFSQGKLKIVHICEVHKIPQIDANSNTQYEWIVQKVDMSEYERLNAAESEFNDNLLELEQKAVKEKAAVMLTEHLGIESTSMDSAIKKLNGGSDA